MYDIELVLKISQFRRRELIELAEQERLIRLARLNKPSNQNLSAKIIDLFKPSLANNGNKGKTCREQNIPDPCCFIIK